MIITNVSILVNTASAMILKNTYLNLSSKSIKKKYPSVYLTMATKINFYSDTKINYCF